MKSAMKESTEQRLDAVEPDGTDNQNGVVEMTEAAVTTTSETPANGIASQDQDMALKEQADEHHSSLATRQQALHQSTGQEERPSTTPGAVAISGGDSSPGPAADCVASTPNLEPPADSAPTNLESETSIMVEATPVHEIVATEVIVQPDELLPNSYHPQDIQQVDIDNFDTTQAATRSNERISTAIDPTTEPSTNDPVGPKIRPLAVTCVVISILVLYAAVGYVMLDVIAMSRQDIIDERDDGEEVTECLLVQEDIRVEFEKLLGTTRLTVVVGDILGVVLVYQLLDLCQDRFCRDRTTPNYRGIFFVHLILGVLEVLWLVTSLVSLFQMEVNIPQDPADLLDEFCPPSEQLDEMGSLDTSYTFNMMRISLLLFIVITRAHVIYDKGVPSDRVTRCCRLTWFWTMVLFDLVALGLSSAILNDVVLLALQVERFETSTNP